VAALLPLDAVEQVLIPEGGERGLANGNGVHERLLGQHLIQIG